MWIKLVQMEDITYAANHCSQVTSSEITQTTEGIHTHSYTCSTLSIPAHPVPEIIPNKSTGALVTLMIKCSIICKMVMHTAM